MDDLKTGENTGLKDRDGTDIRFGDLVQLDVGRESRIFRVQYKTVTREVISHPGFDDPTAKVNITGVVFSWMGFDLFPCVDGEGVSDVSQMKVIGGRVQCRFCRHYDKDREVCCNPTSPYWADATDPGAYCMMHGHISNEAYFGGKQ